MSKHTSNKEINPLLSWLSLGFFLIPFLLVAFAPSFNFFCIASVFMLIVAISMWSWPSSYFPIKHTSTVVRWFIGLIASTILLKETSILAEYFDHHQGSARSAESISGFVFVIPYALLACFWLYFILSGVEKYMKKKNRYSYNCLASTQWILSSSCHHVICLLAY